jgi:hypothetical protein
LQNKTDAFRKVFQSKLEKRDYDFKGVFFPEPVNFVEHTFSTDVDFSSATFSEGAFFIEAAFSTNANFSSATFNGTPLFITTTFRSNANFSSVRFDENALFTLATFSGNANFSSTRFGADADFSVATFSAKATFTSATFKANASFRFATFGPNAGFSFATFEKLIDFTGTLFERTANFQSVRVNDKVLFHECRFTDTTLMRFDQATFDKAERVSFHTVALKTRWFVNVDSRKFEFLNVTWLNWQDYAAELNQLKMERQELTPDNSEEKKLLKDKEQSLPVPAEEESKPLEEKKQAALIGITQVEKQKRPERLLAVAYRNLAVNAEENHRYGEAADFRYAAMDLWQPGPAFYQFQPQNPKSWNEAALWMVHRLYHLMSGYGERIGRAMLILAGILILFAASYRFVGFEVKPQAGQVSSSGPTDAPLPWPRAMAYSLGVGLLQKPEPKPYTTTALTLVYLETLLAPLQGALLALAIRRRFMK